jgi:hypothetical protein
MIPEATICTYMDMSLEAWNELKKYWVASRGLETMRLLEEIVYLRGKVSFYESRISDMNSRISK